MNREFTPEVLRDIVLSLPRADRYWVAYSGGVDSHVLLQALAVVREALPARLAACHVNHGLNAKAGDWADHCRRICEDLAVDYHRIDINAAAPRGESQEAWSRSLRYDAFRELLQEGGMLLTAHQADDQAETLLLQLLRGAGPAGLAAMPAAVRFGSGWHVRPLLDFTREQLRDYARSRGLIWIEDASNLDTRFDRNYLRREIMPRLARRWPALAATLGRSAVLQAESLLLLEQLAEADMRTCHDPSTATLALAEVQALPLLRQRNLLRYWLRRQQLPVPDHRQLQAILTDLIPAAADAAPCVSWPGAEVRRYRERLYALVPLPETETEDAEQHWELHQPLRLPLGELRAARVRGGSLRAILCTDAVVTVRFRAGGENIRRPGREHHQALKKLFQEHGIPPWLRSYIPLVYIDDALASVAGVWHAGEFVAGEGEEGWELEWTATGQVFGD